LEYAQFFNKYSDLQKLNWEIIKSDRWGRQYGPERKEIKQAECLIYKHLPLSAIIGIGCKTERLYNIVSTMIQTSKQKIIIQTKPEWYY
jgi:hypothetical protein